ncbi:MAG TPA: ABC-type transport auxiliary lipoprotein family protein [Bryobacteraceae bacterium]|nr:ABC-type transport auxiliary lipoprotein family protein [Bryobacteraceae bacterium]
MLRCKSVLLTALLGVTLAGCGGKIQYPNYYILSLPAPPSAQRTAPILGSVAIREFTAPGFLTGSAIAYRPSPEQIGFYDYHRWAEDPRHAVAAAVVREIESRGVFQSVDLFDGRSSPAYIVSGRLDHLEEVDGRDAVSIEASLSAKLTEVASGKVLWQGSSTETTKLDQRSMAGVVAEMSRDVSVAVERLVSSMQDRILSQGSLNFER